MLNRFLLIIPLAIPLCGYSQGYADSPFYKIVPAVPSTARALGRAPGGIANGIVIDISIDPAPSGPRFISAWVDKSTPEHMLHYFRQYDELNAVFGYDLRVEPIRGTDQIRCTFTTLTDRIDPPENEFERRLGLGLRNKSIPVVALPGALNPFVIKSGDAISITTLPRGPGKNAVVEYLRLTRSDLAHDSDSPQ